MSSEESEGPPAIADLSQRQYECLIRAGEGMNSKEIGRALGISPSTVDNHIHAAIIKLQAKNRWHAAQLLHPLRQQNGPDQAPPISAIPALGGRENVTPAGRRLVQIAAIGVLSVIGLSSMTVLILGAIHIFQPH